MKATFEALSMQNFAAPLRFRFRHATREHRASEAIIVTVKTTDGFKGHGEIQVRPYLSGETLEGAVEFVENRLWPRLKDQTFGDISALWAALRDLHTIADDANFPAAYTGLELAVISGFCASKGHRINEAVAALFAEAHLPRTLLHSPKITVMSPLPIIHRWLQRLLGIAFALSGVRAVKMKVGPTDLGKLFHPAWPFAGIVTCLGYDANGSAQADQWLSLKQPEFQITFIEQPTARIEEDRWLDIASRTGGVIIADESICTVGDAQRLRKNPGCGGWNLRYAKNGGFVGIQRILALTPDRPFRIHLGSLVGETVILKKAFQALTHELQFDVVEPSRSELLLQRQPDTSG